jgi:SAM-dependent methyltransferase
VKHSFPEAAAFDKLAELTGLDCRFCGNPLQESFVDLGLSPLCQKHTHIEEINHAEPFYPLHAFVCDRCFLVQLGEFVAPDDIFGTYYHYFSSFSDSWLEHAKTYAEAMIARLGLDTSSQVVEIASNDGYLLQYFAERGVPAYGIEPATNVAKTARARGIDTVVEFFGQACAEKMAKERGQPDLLLGNNVLAHVPDVNDFVSGMARLLAPGGTITMEFPHLMRLVAESQFDTIYHEHFSYFSFSTVEKIFAHHGLTLVDVEELPTHGGSLRIFAQHTQTPPAKPSQRVAELKAREQAAGMLSLPYYRDFSAKAERIRRDLMRFLFDVNEAGESVVGYGAPGKGNTLLNYCGIRADLMAYTVDRSPAKQGTFLPGSRIPVYGPERIDQTQPDYVLIMPWNLKEEITTQMSHIRDWGGRFVTAIPELTIT